MGFKSIYCVDCGCEVIVKKMDGRTKRCKEHQDKFNKEYQNNYQKDYFQLYRRVLAKEDGRQRTYKRKYISSDEDIKYCKNNWDKIDGCLNCKCTECIQPTSNDDFLPWEQEGFYKDDERIDYKIERSIG
jgi:hypothetical protein